MTREELFAYLEANAFASMIDRASDDDKDAFLFKKKVWQELHDFCRKMNVEPMPEEVVCQLRKENKL